MLLDPFTIVAQVVNFVVLVVALKFLLYDRVIRAMDEREAGIAARLAQADERRAQAEQKAEDLARAEQEVADARDDVLAEAREQAAARRREMLAEAREEVDEQRERWHRSLERERADLDEELQRRTALVVVELTRSALADLADVDLERAVVQRALRRLAGDEQVRTALFDTRGPEPVEVVVRSAFPLEEQTEAVRTQLDDLGPEADLQVRFEQDERLVVGVEISADGTAVDWNARDYLDRLESAIDEVLDEVIGARGEDDGDGR